jgi:transposase
MDPAAQRKFLEVELEPRLSRAKGENNTVIQFEKIAETRLTPTEADSGINSTDSPLTADEPERADNGMQAETGYEVKEPEGTANTITPDINEGQATTKTAKEQMPYTPQKSVVLFMDTVHCVWQAVLGVLWSMERIFIPASSGRKRVNVLGAYDPVANKLLKIITRTYINSITVCDMLSQIALIYAGKFVTVVLDNASYQHCDLVINTAKALGIELLFLPIYSPNLNLIERLWKFLKAKCLTNEFYNTSREFEDAITTCLDKIETEYAEDVKRLMSMKFHLYDTFDERPTYFGKNKKVKNIAQPGTYVRYMYVVLRSVRPFGNYN